MGVEDEGFSVMAVVKFKGPGQGFSLFEGNDGKQGVARKGQIEYKGFAAMRRPIGRVQVI
jgi:hypothetical protein